MKVTRYRRCSSAAMVSLLSVSSLAMAQSQSDDATTLEALDVVSDAITAPDYMPLEKTPAVGKLNVPVEEQP